MAKDGALLMADDANGVLYRVAYAADAKKPLGSNAIAAAPASQMLAQTSAGSGVAIATERTKAPPGAVMVVTSPSFARGGEIPPRHSDYADGVSPMLTWRRVAKAQSYAVVVEDPDAKPVTPFVHWIAWNIPATMTQLPEGLQKQARLTEPDGMLQGKTSRGSVGYYGPKPPVSDVTRSAD